MTIADNLKQVLAELPQGVRPVSYTHLHPISEDIILDLLSRPNQTEEGEQMLKEVWKRMKKEKGNK